MGDGVPKYCRTWSPLASVPTHVLTGKSGNRLETVRYQRKSIRIVAVRRHGERRVLCSRILSPAVVVAHGLVAGCRVNGVGNSASPE